MNKIIMFCGKECPDCIAEQPTVDRLISEGMDIEQSSLMRKRIEQFVGKYLTRN